MRRHARGILVVSLPWLAALPAWAQTASPEALLERGRTAYENLECARALKAFRAAAAHPKATPAQKAEAYVGSAWCHVVDGDEEAARGALMKALEIRPEYPVPPDLSPKLAKVLEAARSAYRARAPVRIQLDVSARGAPPELGLRVEDPAGQVERVVVHYETPDGPKEAEATRTGPGLWTASLPGAPTGAAAVYVETYNRYGFVSGREGSKEAPVGVRVEAPPAASTHEAMATKEEIPGSAEPTPTGSSGGILKPLAWSAAGLSAAALGTGIYFGMQARAEEARFNGDPSQFASQDEAIAVGRAAQQHAAMANVLFIGAGVLAATGGALFYLGMPQDAEVDLTAAPLPEGGMLVVGGRFP